MVRIFGGQLAEPAETRVAGVVDVGPVAAKEVGTAMDYTWVGEWEGVCVGGWVSE